MAGQLRVSSCSHWDFRTCAVSYPPNGTYILTLQLEQARDAVTGSFELRTVTAPGVFLPINRLEHGVITGSIAADGTLVADGTVEAVYPSSNPTTVHHWRTRIGDDRMVTGEFVVESPSFQWLERPLAPLVRTYQLQGLRRPGS